MSVTKFYRHEVPSESGYWLKDIWTWDKIDLEQKHDFIQSLFPLEQPGVVPSYLLTDRDIEAFKTDSKMQENVLKSFLLMLDFYGLQINDTVDDVIRIRPIKQVINGVTTGLYSTHNYRRITRIITFLRKIGQEYLAQLLFLGLCRDLRDDLDLREKVNAQDGLEHWMAALGLETKNYDFENMQIKKSITDLNLHHIYEIIKQANFQDVVHLCQTNKHFKQMCKEPLIKNLIQKKFAEFTDIKFFRHEDDPNFWIYLIRIGNDYYLFERESGDYYDLSRDTSAKINKKLYDEKPLYHKKENSSLEHFKKYFKIVYGISKPCYGQLYNGEFIRNIHISREDIEKIAMLFNIAMPNIYTTGGNYNNISNDAIANADCSDNDDLDDLDIYLEDDDLEDDEDE